MKSRHGLERITGVGKDDPRSDLYFAGCMWYHMLTGKSPLLETRDRIQRLNVSRFHEVEPITEIAPELPHRVVQVIQKAMSLNVEERYQTPADMLRDLQVIKQTLAGGEAALSPAETSAADQP